MKFRGFTLIEMLAVIAVIGIISTLSVGSFKAAQRKSRDNRRKADINLIAQAVDLYYAETRTVPNVADDGTCDSDVIESAKDPQSLIWIPGLQPEYVSSVRGEKRLPRDPKEPTFTYSYQCLTDEPGKSYKVWATLEGKDIEAPSGVYAISR